MLLQNSQLAALDFFENVGEEYGIDPEGPLPSAHLESTANDISVPSSRLKFSDVDLTALHQTVNPNAVSENYGIDLYERTLNFIANLTPV